MKLNISEERRPLIDMIPLIDSVFLVLIVFIYSFLSMTVHRGFVVNLPKTVVSERLEEPDFISVTVKQDGAVFFNKEEVTDEELALRLLESARADAETKVYVNADEGVIHRRVIAVLESARQAGLKQVALEVAQSRSESVAQ